MEQINEHNHDKSGRPLVPSVPDAGCCDAPRVPSSARVQERAASAHLGLVVQSTGL